MPSALATLPRVADSPISSGAPPTEPDDPSLRLIELAAFNGDGRLIGRWTCEPTAKAIEAELHALDGHPKVRAYRDRGEGVMVLVPGFGVVWPIDAHNPYVWLTAGDANGEPRYEGKTLVVTAGHFTSGRRRVFRDTLASVPMYGGGRTESRHA